MLRRPSFDPVAELAAVITDERETIARLWAKRLRSELHEVEARSKELREPLLPIVTELGRLLRDRGEEALRLWPELVRVHGIRRYDLRYEPEDLGREMKVLQQVLLRVYARRRGRVEREVAEFLAELVGEATAAMHAAYARVLRTEEVRLRETAVMESLLEHIDVGIVLAEEDGRVSFVTPPVSRLVGLPGRVLVGAGADALRAILTQLNARHLDGSTFRTNDLPYVRALREKREVRGTMMVIERHPECEEVILELTAMPVWEEDADALYGAVMTMVDRTETTHRARELSHAYDQLRRLQGRLLQRTRAQALGQLASGAAHNLNNFLNVLRLRLTLLRREYKPEYLEALDKSINNITELVARLQDFANGRSDEELVDAPFNTVAREALEQVRAELERGDGRVELEMELSGAPLTHVDVNALRELLVNLTLAARARMENGGRIRVASREEDGWVELALHASAPPFDPDEIVRLFDPLKGKTPAPHLTLLLAVGRQQVQRWGGELWGENVDDGSGTAFRIRLPVAQPASREEPPREPARPLPRREQSRSVLVVDDDMENARMLAQVLIEEGYEVRVAQSGDEALRMWELHGFDAALLDALMPDVSGWAIAREIRKRTPDARLAVVTGGDVRGQNRENLALVDAVFRKPIDVGALDDFLSQSSEEQPSEEPLVDESDRNKTVH